MGLCTMVSILSLYICGVYNLQFIYQPIYYLILLHALLLFAIPNWNPLFKWVHTVYGVFTIFSVWVCVCTILVKWKQKSFENWKMVRLRQKNKISTSLAVGVFFRFISEIHFTSDVCCTLPLFYLITSFFLV